MRDLGQPEEWPVESVHLNHLEAMGIAMALYAEKGRDGLSQPQRDALDKIETALAGLLDQLGRPA
jgi:hypothetical protein